MCSTCSTPVLLRRSTVSILPWVLVMKDCCPSSRGLDCSPGREGTCTQLLTCMEADACVQLCCEDSWLPSCMGGVEGKKAPSRQVLPCGHTFARRPVPHPGSHLDAGAGGEALGTVQSMTLGSLRPVLATFIPGSYKNEINTSKPLFFFLPQNLTWAHLFLYDVFAILFLTFKYG